MNLNLEGEERDEEEEEIAREVDVDHISEKGAIVKRLRQVNEALERGDLRMVLEYFEEKIREEKETSESGVPRLLNLTKGELDEHRAGMLERGAAEREKYERLAKIVRHHLNAN